MNEARVCGYIGCTNLATEDYEWAMCDGCYFGVTDDFLCHCGRIVKFGYDGDPTHHRGMCENCDRVRCDAYPGECPHDPVRVVEFHPVGEDADW